MTERDQKWNMKYEKLVEYKRTNGHCMVPFKYQQDKALGEWVSTQRTLHKNNKKKFRPDRKRILDEIGFVWTVENTTSTNDKLWHLQHEKLVEFKRTNGHCLVPFKYQQDKALGNWVSKQRKLHKNNKMRPDREKLLDKIGFAWKHCTLAVPSSTTDVRGRVIVGLFHALGGYHVSHSRSLSSYYLCRIRIRRLSPAV
jgi:hypothetical protein